MSADETSNFIRDIVAADLRTGRWDGRVVTRFPPEPNGYPHIGHAKSICLNFGIARDYAGGIAHLRFDDTNPVSARPEFVEAMERDVRWLGFDWGEHLYFASSYFGALYEHARELIRRGRAYVCDLDGEAVRANRGTPSEPGTPSPFRERSAEENLDLFARMRDGEFEEGSRTLRAKIDMASPNMNLRDPVFYRIQKTPHYRTGTEWSVYPLYDFAHPISDSIERITHSICTLEFEDHRPLYDWVLDALELYHPQQIEFARLNLGYTLMSKRKLAALVEEGHVRGWDDPRMPTISALRRRGFTPASVRDFATRVGVAKKDVSIVAPALLEHCVREDLNLHAQRAMAVLRPLRLVIENYPAPGNGDGSETPGEELDAVNNPADPSMGTRRLPFSGVVYIEREDFLEDPPSKFYRLAPGREVRLRYAYLVTCTEVIKDESGEVAELRCRYDPETRGGDAPDGRKVKGTIHWVSAAHAQEAEIRLYDSLFSEENPEGPDGQDFRDHLDPHSIEVLHGAKIEPMLGSAEPGERFQFERQGYFCVDPDSQPGKPVFNRTVTLRDTWAKVQKKS